MPDWVLFAYYITGGPLLAVVATVGLWQLWQAKKSLDVSRRAIEVAESDIVSRTLNDRTRLTVDMSIRFAENVLPLIDDANDVLRSKPLPSPSPDADIWEISSYRDPWDSGFLGEMRARRVIRALNAMEAIAIPFVSSAADAAAVRDSFGIGFVSSAERFAYVVAAIRGKHDSRAYPALRQLHSMWSS